MGIKEIIDEQELKYAFQLIEQAHIPSPPQLLTDLKKELSSENPNEKVVIDLIHSDIGLASSVIKTINSPLYGLNVEIDSLEHAIRLIGFKQLKEYIILPAYKMALTQSFDGFHEVSEHSHQIGVLAEVIASQVETKNRGMYYLAGLFHDVGILVLGNQFPGVADWYKKLEYHPLTLSLYEKEKFNVTHTSIGVLLAKKWGLSNTICSAIYLHHRAYATYKGFIDEESVTMAAVLKLASFYHNKVANPDNIGLTECRLLYMNAIDELMLEEEQLLEIESELIEIAA